MTVETLADTMCINEFMRWMLLERIEPYGEAAAWLRAGLSFDFETGISKAPQQRQGLAGRKEFHSKGAEEMNKAMQALMKEFPDSIRMRPKKTN